MMEKASSVPIFFFITILFSSALLPELVNSQTDSCSSNLNLDNLPFDASSLNCAPVWAPHNYILRYRQTSPTVWSFVLSAPASNSYVGMGFSSNGRMVGSSAIVGWISSGQTGTIKRYFLGGQTPRQVVPDQGNLNVNNSMVISQASRIYLIFQLNTDKPSSRLIYSVGPDGVLPAAPAFTLTQHRDMAATNLNYVTGEAQTQGTPYSRLRKSHGILNMLGWGILMIIGAIAARHFKQWDPLWFYCHTLIQSLAFLLGLSGVVSGLVLHNKLDVDVSTHKSLGITILVLGCLQVMAFLARPDKESKVRKYWNWYHHTIGRVLIILAIANVFYGIHLGEKGSGWRSGYAVVIAFLFLIAIILEIRMWMRK